MLVEKLHNEAASGRKHVDVMHGHGPDHGMLQSALLPCCRVQVLHPVPIAGVTCPVSDASCSIAIASSSQGLMLKVTPNKVLHTCIGVFQPGTCTNVFARIMSALQQQHQWAGPETVLQRRDIKRMLHLQQHIRPGATCFVGDKQPSTPRKIVRRRRQGCRIPRIRMHCPSHSMYCPHMPRPRSRTSMVLGRSVPVRESSVACQV